jgi:glycerate kinase
MKFLVAPNALKGSCSAAAAARAMARGVLRARPTAEVVELPVADGGDGLMEVVTEALGAERVALQVAGPRFSPVFAELAWLPQRRTAVIEMALASGLALLAPGDRDPGVTTSLGTGELIAAALGLGAETILVGIGGSATNDGGIGMATALGYRFVGADGEPVSPVGGRLGTIERIDASGVDPRLAGTRIEVLCDVDNPLTGPRGASRVYGPQKGADAAQVERLDAGLARLADLTERDLGCRVRDLSGAGAAGGLGAGLVCFCGAQLRRGAEAVLDLVQLDAHLEGADLVLTAEGRIDGQTRFGKAPGAVAAHARKAGVPCVAIAGGIGEDAHLLHAGGIDALVSLCPGPVSLEEAQVRAEELLADAAEQVVRIFLARRG